MGLSGLILFASGAIIGATTMPREVIKTVQVPYEVIRNVTVEVPVELPVEVIKEVEKVVEVIPQSFLEYIYDQEGNLSELDTSDLDDDELDQIVSRIAFLQESKVIALESVKSELFSELDREEFTMSDNSTVKFDEDDLERLRLDDESDEVVIDSVDFDDSDAEVIVTGRFEQDDVKYSFEALVVIKDGEFDEISSIDVDLL